MLGPTSAQGLVVRSCTMPLSWRGRKGYSLSANGTVNASAKQLVYKRTSQDSTSISKESGEGVKTDYAVKVIIVTVISCCK